MISFLRRLFPELTSNQPGPNTPSNGNLLAGKLEIYYWARLANYICRLSCVYPRIDFPRCTQRFPLSHGHLARARAPFVIRRTVFVLLAVVRARTIQIHVAPKLLAPARRTTNRRNVSDRKNREARVYLALVSLR